MTRPMSMTRAGLALTVLASVLAGCASNVKLTDPPPVETRKPELESKSANTGANPNAGAQSNVASVDLTKSDMDANAGIAKVIYFDFDSFVVKDEYRSIVEANAKFLANNKAKKIQIEGHTDERGGREYNLALGQKRAEAVQKSLTLLGVPESQLESVSYGKERPAVTGSDEAAWAKNRRAELKDR